MSGVRSARSRRFSIGSSIAFFALVVMVCWGSSSSVFGQSDDARFLAHLNSGEFGPAIDLAHRNPNLADRDSMLRGVADAQARAGAFGASLHTAGSIRGDASRGSAFDSLTGNPLFNSAGGRGGAALADFDSLIDLITQTISPDSWADAGGVGAIEPFPGGVYVDASGTMRRIAANSVDDSLAKVRRSAMTASGNRDVRQTSPLRKVSLTRLERQAQTLWAAGKRPDDAMRMMAGLTKIKYVLVYPESRDIVLAGPAGDWTTDPEGRVVNSETGRPVLQLDDFVVVLRNAFSSAGRFGCSITPQKDRLADVQAFLNESSKRSLKPTERDRWLDQLREKLGPQNIEVFGIDPRTRAAQIVVEADYRMKLVGMGLEPGTVGVTSYLDSIAIPPGGSAPPMDVLRWWFTLNYESLKTTDGHDAFEIVGPGVKVLSENELLTERGERVHTGDAKLENRQFAQSFTRHIDALAIKYPIYAELRNVFDLALVAALIREENLADLCEWNQPYFGSKGKYQFALGTAPKQVDSVLNYRLIDRRHLVVGVSGGVMVDTSKLVKDDAIKTDTYGLLKAERGSGAPPKLPQQAWWWD